MVFYNYLPEYARKEEIEEAIEHWEEQFATAAEIGHREGRQEIQAILIELDDWLQKYD